MWVVIGEYGREGGNKVVIVIFVVMWFFCCFGFVGDVIIGGFGVVIGVICYVFLY